MIRLRLAALMIPIFMTTPLSAQQDAEGCKDHPLFNRLPNFVITNCESSQFDLKRFPQGPLKENAEGEKRAKPVEIEGPTWKIDYELKEGATRPSALQIMRNFQAAAKKAGAAIEGEYPGWCPGMLDESLSVGNGCMHHGVTMRFTKANKEVWAYVQAGGDGERYELVVSEREAMKQEIVANELVDKIDKDGFVALYINFDTGKATIKQDSNEILDKAAEALKSASALKIEVGGHTDNVGTPAANLKLSEDRAKAVAAALVARGVEASRLTAKGYGQSNPVADNRAEDGRAKNRRVELTKR